MATSEIIFEVTHALEGGYDARTVDHSIITQGNDWDDLKSMAQDAVASHFDGNDTSKLIRLHLVTNQIRFQGKSKRCPRNALRVIRWLRARSPMTG